jgi:hypothetical protein
MAVCEKKEDGTIREGTHGWQSPSLLRRGSGHLLDLPLYLSYVKDGYVAVHWKDRSGP